MARLSKSQSKESTRQKSLRFSGKLEIILRFIYKQRLDRSDRSFRLSSIANLFINRASDYIISLSLLFSIICFILFDFHKTIF